jgi:hypothetical protein
MSQTMQESKASAMMISGVFMDVFIPRMIAAARGGSQATEGELFRQHINCLKSVSAFLRYLFRIAGSIECLKEHDPRFIEFYRP